MIDREKVIKGLEICYCPPAKCEDCPYHDLPDEQSCNDTLCLDALALLKEQEAVVRCKDCKHWIGGGIDEKDNFIPPRCKLNNIIAQHNWYCADGEKRCDDG